jgi:triosephosphate isomerase
MKKILVVGNWKTNPKTYKEAKKLLKGVESLVKKSTIGFGYAVPDIYFSLLGEEKMRGLLGVQNVGTIGEGAHTGKSSVGMYASSGVEFVILGHSEVRKDGETNQSINEKLEATLANKVLSIVCVGESERDQDGMYLKFIEDQLKQILVGIKADQCGKLVIAYEPLWAIGSGVSATSEQCFEVIIMIRRTLASILGIENAKKVLVLYGGSTNKLNAVDFIIEGSADGLLVGKSSLDEKEFGGIINNIYEAIR